MVFDEEVIHCQSCGLWETSLASACGVSYRVSGIGGVGSSSATIMLVGEAPGEEEVLHQQPFVGRAGKLLSETLKSLGVSRDSVFITNVVRCRPPQNRVPTGKEVRACLPQLVEEIKALRPKVVVLLGATALKAVLGISSGVTSLSGRPIKSEVYDTTCVPVIHPSFVLRNRTKEVEGAFRAALKAAIDVAQVGQEKKDDRYKICEHPDEVLKLADFLVNRATFSYDIETTDLDYNKGDILCISFSWAPHRAACVPWMWVVDRGTEKQRVENRWSSNVQELVYEQLQRILTCSVPKIAQNGKFDNGFILSRWGINVKNFAFDTMLAHHCVSEEGGYGSHGLDSLALSLTDMDPYWANLKPYLPTPETPFTEIPEPILYHYSCADADATFRCAEAIKPVLEQQGLTSLFYKIVMPYNKLLLKMEMRGIAVDKKKLDQLISVYTKKVEVLAEELHAFPEIKKAEASLLVLAKQKKKTKKEPEEVVFNPNSNHHVRMLLYGNVNSGTTDVEALEYFGRRIKAAGAIAHIRKVKKFLSTYLIGTRECLGVDGRLHTNYSQHVTVTGRLSSRKPNLQNQPKHGEGADEIRSVFVAKPGCYLLEGDYKQAEFRCWGQYSQDPDLLKDIRDGVDIHTEMAVILFHKKHKEVTELDRFVAKMSVFGIIYGRSAKSISEQYGISEQDAERVKREFFCKYPRAEEWIKEAQLFAVTNGYVVNWFGRRRRLPILKNVRYANGPSGVTFYTNDAKEAEALRQSVNAPIQGMAHDCLKVAGLRIDRRFKKEGLKSVGILDIHDAVICEVPDNELDTAAEVVQEEMERPIAGMTVPMRADLSYGRRWSEMVKYKQKEVK